MDGAIGTVIELPEGWKLEAMPAEQETYTDDCAVFPDEAGQTLIIRPLNGSTLRVGKRKAEMLVSIIRQTIQGWK